MSNCFSRIYRLNNESDFSRLLTQGTRLTQDSYLRLIWVPNICSHPRLGLRITKKAVVRAVDRNRLKRIIRESFRLHQNDLQACDILMSVRKGIEQLSSEAIQQHLNLLWPQCSH